MKFLSFFFLLGLLASAFGGKPSTPRDVHLDSTLVTISDSITPDGIEHVFIEIDRIEDDLTDSGKLLAERDIRVALRFEVDQAQQVLVNGVVAPFGYSELSVEAQIYEVSSNEEHIPFGEVVAVMIRVYVGQGEVVLNTGMTVSTLVVQERVVGIQETEVWQAEVVQQVFVVQQDGAAVRFETTKINVVTGEPSDLLPPPPNAMPPQEMPPQEKPEHHGGHHQGGHHGNGGHHEGGHHHGHGGHHQQEGGAGAGEEPEIAVDPYPGMWMEGGEQEQPPSKHECAMTKKMREFFHLAARWFHGLPFYLRLLVAFAGGVGLGLAGILLAKFLCCLCSGGKKRCCSAKGACSQQKGDYKQNIRVYSLQYTAVPQDDDEKKEKKQEKKEERKEENAIQMV